jgi:molybdenum transport protein
MERLPDPELLRWLQEDAPHGDLTSRALGLSQQPGIARFHARRAMRVAAIEEAARLFELCGAQASVIVASGRDAAPDELLLEARGSAGALLLAWKIAQTAVEAASGVAGAAAHIVGLLRAQGFTQPLACTRKNWPGGRALAARAVWACRRRCWSFPSIATSSPRMSCPGAWPRCAPRSRRRSWWSRSATPTTRCWPPPPAPRCCSSNASAPRRWPRCD